MRFSLDNRGIDKENLCCWEKHKKIKKLLKTTKKNDMLFTDVVITARVERRLVHGYERYFSMRKTCHESYLGFNRGSGITGYHEQSKSGERKKLEATDGFYFSGKTG